MLFWENNISAWVAAVIRFFHRLIKQWQKRCYRLHQARFSPDSLSVERWINLLQMQTFPTVERHIKSISLAKHELTF